MTEDVQASADQPDTPATAAVAIDAGADTVGTHPEASNTGDPPRTGVASVDAAADRLSELDDAPVDAHVGIYEDVHHRLQEGLADLDDQ